MNNVLTSKNHSQSTKFLNALNSDPGFDADSIRTAGLRSKVPIVGDATGYFLSLICSTKQPENILEIGSGFGYSANFLLTGYVGSRLVSLDTNIDRVNISREFCRKNGFQERVEFRHESAKIFFETCSQQFDMIFLDSMKKEYPDLLESCVKHLNPQGILIADNILFQNRLLPEHVPEPKYIAGIEGMRHFIELVRQHPQLHTVFLPIDDGIMVSTKHA